MDYLKGVIDLSKIELSGKTYEFSETANINWTLKVEIFFPEVL